MKPGSLVTPRWTHPKMVEEILKLDILAAMSIKTLPEFSQVYTIDKIDTCPCCGKAYCRIAEMPVIFFGRMRSKGLPINFYVEIAPPEENSVQSMIDKILDEQPLVVEHV